MDLKKGRLEEEEEEVKEEENGEEKGAGWKQDEREKRGGRGHLKLKKLKLSKLSSV